MLNIILKQTNAHFNNLGQFYLVSMYTALFSTTYFGLFRVGELADSEHSVKTCDVHIGTNKNKVLFVLRSSKTHCKSMEPQIIKICSNSNRSARRNDSHLCPFYLLRVYLSKRSNYKSLQENFFIFKDGSPVRSYIFRQTLKDMIKLAGFGPYYYSTHSL